MYVPLEIVEWEVFSQKCFLIIFRSFTAKSLKERLGGAQKRRKRKNKNFQQMKKI